MIKAPAEAVESAWRKLSAFIRDSPPRSPLPGEVVPVGPVVSEHDLVFHLARLVAEELGDPSWVHLEWSLGAYQRMDLALLDPSRWMDAPTKKGPRLEYGVEAKIVLDEVHKNYSPGAVDRDVSKLKALLGDRILAGAVFVLDKRTRIKVPIEEGIRAGGIRVFVLRPRDAESP